MTVGLKDTVANGWLDGLGTGTGTANVFWVGLHTGDPGTAGTASACSGTTGAARKSVAMGAAAAGVKNQSGSASWASWDGGSVTINNISVWTASAAGTFQFSAALSTARSVNNGDTFNLTTLQASITGLAS